MGMALTIVERWRSALLIVKPETVIATRMLRRKVQPPELGKLVELPQVGGLISETAIFGCADADLRLLRALQMKILSHIANRRDGCRIGTVLEVKKEIPAKRNRDLT
jgi:hypothetical protein